MGAIRLRRPLAISVSAAARLSDENPSAEKKSGMYRLQCIRFRVYHRLWHTSRVQYELLVGLRYTRAKRRNHFISFISLTSMLGIALGVAALIVVLSVMNGFQKEVRARILGVVSHVQITGVDNRLADWQAVARESAQHPQVAAAAPLVNAPGMLVFGAAVRGALVRRIVPEHDQKVAEIGLHMTAGKLESLVPGGFRIVVG